LYYSEPDYGLSKLLQNVNNYVLTRDIPKLGPVPSFTLKQMDNPPISLNIKTVIPETCSTEEIKMSCSQAPHHNGAEKTNLQNPNYELKPFRIFPPF